MADTPRLLHENLDVYRASIDFLVLASELSRKVPRGHSMIADQLRRASLSIPLNIAEGCGRRGVADERRFYDIARGSAHECGAILDALKAMALAAESEVAAGKALLVRIVSMLVKMARP